MLFWSGWNMSLDSISIWNTLRIKFRQASGTKLNAIYVVSQKLRITATQWRYFSNSGNRNIWKLLISKILLLILPSICWHSTEAKFIWILYNVFILRNDRPKAADILVKDLKVFSSFNEELFKEITQLLTLENFRYQVSLISSLFMRKPFFTLWSIHLDNKFISEPDPYLNSIFLCLLDK